MKIIETETISEKTIFNPDLSSWVYNGLDCCVTHEIRDKLRDELDESPENVRQTYADSMSKLAPLMEMSLRGFRIDQKSLNTALSEMEATLNLLQSNFYRLCQEGLETTCNWRSHVQVKNLFYGILGIKPIKDRNSNGVYAPSSNRKALEKLCNNYYAEPFARHILALRDLGKAIGFLKSEIDPDNRIRSSYNVAGTNTGRLSSSINEFGTGTNLQNVSSALRYPFIADERMIQVNVDLEQADARNLAALIYVHAREAGKDEEFYVKYLNACESGDLHTFVCRMAWSQLNWPEDQSEWRTVADQTAYRDMSYRDLAKRLGHGTNYYGKPATMAKHTQTDKTIIEVFQHKYFSAFPGIPFYHDWVKDQLKYSGQITTLFGRRRFFFGRSNDDSTIREAIAYAPQSMTAHEIDMAYLQLWRSDLPVQLLNQVHDSINFQIPYDGHEEILPLALETMKVYHELPDGRLFTVPLEAKTGYNWGDRIDDPKTGVAKSNPNGLVKWKGGADPRKPPTYQPPIRKKGNSVKKLLK